MPPLTATPVTLLLLVLNVAISGYILFINFAPMERMTLRPQRVLEGQWDRVLTSGFVHVGLGHLAFNMITLFFFGPFLEIVLGPLRFTLLYFGSMLAAHALSIFMHRDDPDYSAVGASGAISGVVFAFILFEPFEMLYLFLAIPIPAILFAVGYVAGSIYAMKQAEASGQRGGIAHDAHLGGAVGGVLLTLSLEPGVGPHFLREVAGLFG
jgi:membrane associated rhomboid family serine protease